MPGIFGAIVGATAIPAAGQTALDALEIAPASSTTVRHDSVADRSRPAYDALGMQVGTLLLLPRVSAGLGYSDNIYAQTMGGVGTGFLAVDPSLVVDNGQADRHLTASGGAAIRRYFGQSARDENGLYSRVDGHLDIDRDVFVEGGGEIRRAYEERFSGSFPIDALGSVEYVTGTAYARAATSTGRWRLLAAIEATNLNFRNVTGINQQVIDQQGRDRLLLGGGARIDFARTPDLVVFGLLRYTDIGYRVRLPDGTDNRNGFETSGEAGVRFDLASPLRGQVSLGYVSRQFRSPLYTPVNGLAGLARVEYLWSALTTIIVDGRRTVQDSDFTGSSAYFVTGGGLRIDHEFLRNLLVDVGVDQEIDTFRGIDRRDRVTTFRTAVHLLGRPVALDVVVSHDSRRSSGQLQGPSFDETRGLLTTTVKY